MEAKERRIKLSATAKREVPDLLCHEATRLAVWDADRLLVVARKIEKCEDDRIGLTFMELEILDHVIHWCAEIDPAGQEDKAIGTFARDARQALRSCCKPGTWEPLPQYAGTCEPLQGGVA